ncbi:MAG: ISKra4 family transposase [Moorea sp. SIO3I7]|nr:ISKra4 family transposase [Moorena sp. SIO3I7]
MKKAEREELEACLKRASEILYYLTDTDSLETLADIEIAVRKQVLEHVSPKIGLFFITKKTNTQRGKTRTIKSCLGKLKITKKQADALGIEPLTRHSPLLEKCCLLLSANESYHNAETDLYLLTGLKVGHSTQHWPLATLRERKVNQIELPPPDLKQGLSEVSVDGGKIRLRTEVKGEPSVWQEYKTARLQGIYYGAFFQDNLSLTDWINSQNLTVPLYCLGDGHDGIWNIFALIGEPQHRIEILDWYHLTENLHKIETNKSIKEQLEAYLWKGQVSEAMKLLKLAKPVGGTNFIGYLKKHRKRLINYHYFQREQICSIGSGAVESAVKQISHRVKLTGAQWRPENVANILQLRCAYLNGQLAI